jgi:hypothetical protein
VLIDRLRKFDESLAQSVEEAINSGKDVLIPEPNTAGKKPRKYRKIERFSDEEALKVALNVLESFFIEMPMMIESANAELANAATGRISRNIVPYGANESPDIEKIDIGKPKSLQITLRTETQLFINDETFLELRPVQRDEISQQKDKLARLEAILNFGTSGNRG